jgi:hypothetical protein
MIGLGVWNMNSDERCAVWRELRDEIVPGLLPYAIDDIEVAYEVDQRCAVCGVQFRDKAGVRVSRWMIPKSLLARLKLCVERSLDEAGLAQGAGVVRVAISRREITMQHHPQDSGDGNAHEAWPL